jgi:hypothetical protein
MAAWEQGTGQGDTAARRRRELTVKETVMKTVAFLPADREAQGFGPLGFADAFGARLREPTGQFRGLPNPARQELLVELLSLVDVEIAHFLLLGLAGRKGAQ